MIKRRLQTMQAAQIPQTEHLFFVSFSYNCDFTYDYFLVTLELFTILGPQPNLQFNRNAWCTVCVKRKLIGQFPSDQKTGLKVSSVFVSFTKNRKYITNCVTVGMPLTQIFLPPKHLKCPTPISKMQPHNRFFVPIFRVT